MRVLITGSRDWDNPTLIAEQLRDLPEDAVLVHGGAKGADRMAAYGWGERWGRMVEEHPAEWNRRPDGSYDRAAGYKRNEKMVNLGADICFAFLANGDGNKGTRHCANLAHKAGIPVIFVHANGQTTRVNPEDENPFAPAVTEWERKQDAAWSEPVQVPAF